jgi:hypothetical protein
MVLHCVARLLLIAPDTESDSIKKVTLEKNVNIGESLDTAFNNGQG